MATETRITSEQGKDAVYQAHLSKDAISKINGLQSSASEIDGSVNKDSQTIVLIGDSLIAQDKASANETSCFGMFEWANALSGHRFKLLNNAGIGGENSTQILARIDNDVLSYNPSHCMFVAGMNNDASIIGSSTNTLISHIIEIYEKLNNAGIYSYILSNTLKTSDNLKTIQAFYVNNYLSNYFKDKPNVSFIDIMKVWIDNTAIVNSAKINVLRDNKHQLNYGAFVAGKEISKYFNLQNKKESILPISAYDSYRIHTDSLNMIKNSLMLGTLGTKPSGVTGELANNIVATISGGTAVCSKVLRDDGLGYNQKIDVTSTGDGYVKLVFDPERTGISIGDNIVAVCEIIIDKSSTNLLFPMFALDFNNIVVKRMFFPSYPSDVRFPIISNEDSNLTLITPSYNIIGSLLSTFNCSVQVNFKGVGNCSFQIGRVGIIKIPTIAH